MNDPYLIVHKVRGKLTFDIGERMTMGEEIWWIIPTSGHRAWPMFTQRLGEIVQNDIYQMVIEGDGAPSALPDHYACNDYARHTSLSGHSTRKPRPSISDL